MASTWRFVNLPRPDISDGSGMLGSDVHRLTGSANAGDSVLLRFIQVLCRHFTVAHIVPPLRGRPAAGARIARVHHEYLPNA